MIYTYQTRPRTRKAIALLCMYYLGLTLLKLWFAVADGIMAVALLVSLPAVYDLARNAMAIFKLDGQNITWMSGRQDAKIALNLVDRIRFDTRLDLSIKMTVILTSGRKIRVPVASTPPIEAIEKVLDSVNVKHERHHFTLLG